MAIRVLIVDDHRIVREGLRALVEKEDGMTWIGQAANGRDAVQQAKDLSPHVVVMDITMPDLNGVEATRLILEAQPGGKVLALSMHTDGRFVRRMLEAGAKGYLLKDCAFEELAVAIRTVAGNRTYLSPRVADKVVSEYVHPPARPPGIPRLTPRQREVLQLIAEGQTTKEIAFHLGRSVKTIETHRSQIMAALGLRSVAELTKYAIREGITDLGSELPLVPVTLAA